MVTLEKINSGGENESCKVGAETLEREDIRKGGFPVIRNRYARKPGTKGKAPMNECLAGPGESGSMCL